MADDNPIDLTIIGSGASGLAAGIKAQIKGLNFRIIAGNQLGGKLQSFTDSSGIRIEKAANIIVEKPCVKELLGILNLKDSVAYPKTRKLLRYIRLDDQLQKLSFPGLIKLLVKDGKFLKLVNAFLPSSVKIDPSTTVFEYTDRLFGSKKFSSFVSGILRGTYGITSDRLALSLVAPGFYRHLCSRKMPAAYLFSKIRYRIFSLKEGNQQLVDTMQHRLKENLIHEECAAISKEDAGFRITTQSGSTINAKKILICTSELQFLKQLCPAIAKDALSCNKTSLTIVHLIDNAGLLPENCLGMLDSRDSQSGFIGVLQPGAAFHHMDSKDGKLYNIFYLGDKSSQMAELNIKQLKEEHSLEFSDSARISAISVWKDAFPEYSPALYKIIDEIGLVEAASNQQIAFSCFYDGKGLGISDRIEQAWNKI